MGQMCSIVISDEGGCPRGGGMSYIQPGQFNDY